MISHFTGIKSRVVFALLFLFPIAGNSLRSWTSALFWMLVLTALLFKPWKIQKLNSIEKGLLATCALIFCQFILSGSLNGWTELQTKGLGVQLRYLGFILIYLLVKHHHESLIALIYGSVAAALVLLAQGLYEVNILGMDRANGVYESPGLFATQAVVFSIVTGFGFVYAGKWPICRSLCLVGLASSLAGLVLSGSRATYLAFAIFAVIFGLWQLRKIKRFLALCALLLVFFIAFITSSIVHQQVNRGVEEISTYLHQSDNVVRSDHGSVGMRLEMWRASLLLFAENPVFGVGWRNFSSAAEPYVEKGLANRLVLGSPHPHNTYLEFLAGYGLIGFGMLASLFLYGFKFAKEKSVRKRGINRLLFWFLIFYLINAVNEGGLFIYGNSVSFFFVYFAILVSQCSIRRSSLRAAQQKTLCCESKP